MMCENIAGNKTNWHRQAAGREKDEENQNGKDVQAGHV